MPHVISNVSEPMCIFVWSDEDEHLCSFWWLNSSTILGFFATAFTFFNLTLQTWVSSYKCCSVILAGSLDSSQLSVLYLYMLFSEAQDPPSQFDSSCHLRKNRQRRREGLKMAETGLSMQSHFSQVRRKAGRKSKWENVLALKFFKDWRESLMRCHCAALFS